MQRHDGAVATRLTGWTLFLYGLPNLSISITQLPIGIYLNDLYATVIGVPLGTVGLAIFLSRLTDVITDPLIGSLSDNWRSPIGRRKFWILLGTPLMLTALWMLFVPPAGVGVWWLFLFVTLVYLANTMIDLPYRAWGADLSSDYHERSRVTGVREMFGLFGNILVVGVPVLMVMFFGMALITDWTWAMALMTVCLLPLFVLCAVTFVHEPTREELHAAKVDWWGGLAVVWRNAAFRRLALMGFIFTVSIGTTTAYSLFYVDHIIGARGIYPYVLFAYFASSILAIFVLWAPLARKIGKHKVVALAIVTLALGSAPMPFLGPADFWTFVVFMLIKGGAIGALLFLPVSMAADVVDLDLLETGRQRTGLYFALWGMILKFAAGVALLTLAFADFSGFESRCPSPANVAAWAPRVVVEDAIISNRDKPADELRRITAEARKQAAALTPDARAALMVKKNCTTNAPQALFTVGIFYSWVPALISLLAWWSMWSYPLTESRQREMRAEIESRKKAAG